MFQFECLDCGHTWDIIFWEEPEGLKTACPQCKSLHVQRFKWMRVSKKAGQQEALADEPQPGIHGSHALHDMAGKFESATHATREPAIKRLFHLIKSILKKGNLNGLTG